MKYCHRCGAKIEEDSLFCTSCGVKQENDSFTSLQSKKKFDIQKYIDLQNKKVIIGIICFLIVFIVIIIAIKGNGKRLNEHKLEEIIPEYLTQYTIDAETYESEIESLEITQGRETDSGYEAYCKLELSGQYMDRVLYYVFDCIKYDGNKWAVNNCYEYKDEEITLTGTKEWDYYCYNNEKMVDDEIAIEDNFFHFSYEKEPVYYTYATYKQYGEVTGYIEKDDDGDILNGLNYRWRCDWDEKEDITLNYSQLSGTWVSDYTLWTGESQEVLSFVVGTDNSVEWEMSFVETIDMSKTSSSGNSILYRDGDKYCFEFVYAQYSEEHTYKASFILLDALNDGICLLDRKDSYGNWVGGQHFHKDDNVVVTDTYDDYDDGNMFEEPDLETHYYSDNRIYSIEATSELPQTDENNYYAYNLMDGDPSTAWSEGISGNGIGEMITINLNGFYDVSGLCLYNGYTKNWDIYYKNGRVKEIKVDFGNGNIITQKMNYVTEEDNMPKEEDIIENNVTSIDLETPITTDKIIITITDAFSGNKYDDVCLSEIILYDNIN